MLLDHPWTCLGNCHLVHIQVESTNTTCNARCVTWNSPTTNFTAVCTHKLLERCDLPRERPYIISGPSTNAAIKYYSSHISQAFAAPCSCPSSYVEVTFRLTLTPNHDISSSFGIAVHVGLYTPCLIVTLFIWLKSYVYIGKVASISFRCGLTLISQAVPNRRLADVLGWDLGVPHCIYCSAICNDLLDMQWLSV